MKVRLTVQGFSSFTCKTSSFGAAILCAVSTSDPRIQSYHACFDDETLLRSDWYCIWYRDIVSGDVCYTTCLPDTLSRVRDASLTFLHPG